MQVMKRLWKKKKRAIPSADLTLAEFFKFCILGNDASIGRDYHVCELLLWLFVAQSTITLESYTNVYIRDSHLQS